MDPDEKDLREREFKQKRWGAIAAVAALATTIVFNTVALNNSSQAASDAAERANVTAEENHYTAAQSNYDTMVNSLGSTTKAVQVLSVRRLVQFVLDSSNYRIENCSRYQSANNLLQAIEILIQEQAGYSGPLHNFASVGVPDETLRVVRQLESLTNNSSVRDQSPDICKTGLPVYLANEDLHGTDLDNWKPSTSSSFSIIYSDLRRTNLLGLDLRQAPGSFRGSALTCANLSGAQFGASDVANADFVGANLSGADMSQVTGLTPQQVAHATTDSGTRLPADLTTPSNSFNDQQCSNYVDGM